METWARRIYQWGLNLYPAGFRERYRAELLEAFDDLWSETQNQRRGVLLL